jgi:serine/threonine protein kinase
VEPLHPSDPQRVGSYRLTARLGSGGMGKVYLARTASGRQVVIKVIRSEHAENEEFRTRFAREAEIARRVGGFHTAQVVDADPDADPPWIATAHIPGPTLDQAVRKHGPIAPPALLVLAAGLAEGLKAVHACGLVHRDLKPGNIILTHDGPRIIDFGIARPLDASSVTAQGAVFGTLPYMSPEQTDGSHVDPPSDVFSLGTVLAYAATGTNPFSGATMAETLRRIISPAPDPGDIAPDVRALIAECWNHDPALRPTPEQILTRFESLDLQDAWPPDHLAALEGIGPATGHSSQPPVSGSASQPPVSGPSSQPPVSGSSSQPSAAGHSSPPRAAGHTSWPPVTGSPSHPRAAGTPSWPPASGSPVSDPPNSNPPNSNPPPLRGPAVGPAPMTAGYRGAPPPPPMAPRPASAGTARTAPSGRAIGQWIVGFVAVATVGILIVAGFVWVSSPDEGNGSGTGPDPSGGNQASETGVFDHGDDVQSIAFSPDGTTLATGGNDDAARVWDIESGDEIAVFEGHEDWVRSVAFSPDGTMLATGGDDRTARVWDIESGEETAVFEGHEDWVRSVAFSPDGTMLATGSDDRTARVWDVESGEETATLEGHEDWIQSVAFSPDGTMLATGGDDSTVRLWDPADGDAIDTLSGLTGYGLTVAFSPDGTTLAAGGSDAAPRIWDVESTDEIATLQGHADAVRSVAFSADGATLISGDDGGTARVWNASTGQEITTLQLEGMVLAAAPDGTTLATADFGTVRLWNVD